MLFSQKKRACPLDICHMKKEDGILMPSAQQGTISTSEGKKLWGMVRLSGTDIFSKKAAWERSSVLTESWRERKVRITVLTYIWARMYYFYTCVWCMFSNDKKHCKDLFLLVGYHSVLKLVWYAWITRNWRSNIFKSTHVHQMFTTHKQGKYCLMVKLTVSAF